MLHIYNSAAVHNYLSLRLVNTNFVQFKLAFTQKQVLTINDRKQ